MPSTSTTQTTQERAQPWQQMPEVQGLFNKPEAPAANGQSGACTEADKTEEEPLKLNLFRFGLNSATTNIADVEEKK